MKRNSQHWLLKKFMELFIIGILVFSLGCDKDNGVDPEPEQSASPTFSMAVLSDLHYFDPDLGTTGSAFQTYLAQDRKMIAESEAILQAAVEAISAEDVDLVLIPGDMTKDGEKTNHQAVAQYLQQLESGGKTVYVVPGNHDIANPHAMAFNGNNATPIESVTADEFKQIYNEFGFDEAIAEDPNSLTYIAEPVPGFWLFCIDDCQYEENDDSPVTGGALSAETLGWIVSQLGEAQNQGKLVFGMMHHGLIEHFPGQTAFFPGYVVDSWTTLWPQFAGLGMKVIFTGHFHAQDIIKKTSSDGFIFDIETGSTVTFPCPYRTIRVSTDQIMTVTSSLITSIQYDTGDLTFQAYAEDFLKTGLVPIVSHMIQNDFGIDEQTADMMAPFIADAIIAHYAGDEQITIEASAFIDQMKNSGDLMAGMLANAIEAIYSDPEPADNDITIDLNTGEATVAAAAKMLSSAMP